MSSDEASHALISISAGRVQLARQQLAKLIADSCPGPHRYVQHRDGKPQWCCVCGYAADGQRINTNTTTDNAARHGHRQGEAAYGWGRRSAQPTEHERP